MSLNLSLLSREVFFFALMIGAGESYLGAYALYLGASPLLIGMIGAAPVALASLGQFAAFYLNRALHIKRILLTTMMIESLAFILLMLPIAFPEHALVYLILASVIYFSVRNITVPTHNLFLKSTIPAETRGEFTGKRQKLTFLTILISLLCFGAILQYAKEYKFESLAYLLIFSVATFSRIVSLLLHQRMEINNIYKEKPSRFSFFSFLRQLNRNNFGRFVILTTLMSFASNLLGGYMAVYFLKQLEMTYLLFAILISLTWLAQYLSVQFWGRLVDKIGTRVILTINCYGVAIIPLLWLCSTNIYWIAFVQVYSGIFWSGYNLATSEYAFDAVEGRNFVKCQAYQATINSAGVLAAVFVSGLYQNYAYQTSLIENPFLLIFAISLFFRVITAMFLTKNLNEVKKFPSDHSLNLNFRFAGLNIAARANLSFFRKD